MYAKIIIDITHEKLDRTFEYEVPKDMEDGLAIGSSVLVRLETRTGCVRGLLSALPKNVVLIRRRSRPFTAKRQKASVLRRIWFPLPSG